MFIITEANVEKTGAKFTEELRIVVWHPINSNGAAKSFGLGLLPSLILFRKPAEAAESLIAQLHSQGELTTPRRENRKIRHEIEILKENEPAPYVSFV
jgi:hypothetical protein